tara:strand:- start:21 stop:902 length:882 start_codon:yes stop_codon:yes gene_type:complete
MSGVKGLPFAEDMMDILDTLMQKFGFKIETVEKEMNEFLNGISPGLSPWVMRGVLDNFTGATMSTRLGMGDMFPLTSVGKAGSDNWQETKNFLGPVWSAFDQALATAGNIALFGGGLVGLTDRNVTMGQILREQPFGGIRGVADSVTFAMDGHITNKQGKVLDKDVAIHELLFRFMNFYPATANYQNDIIRMHKQTADYAKQIKMGFTQDYVKAKLSGDKDLMKSIIKSVHEHNKKHKGTSFEFRAWLPSAERTYRAWKLPAVERYAKFAPKTIRPDLKEMIEMYGVDVEYMK